MYSTTTGEMTHPFYHPSEVVGIVPHPSKKEVLIICLLTVIVWY